MVSSVSTKSISDGTRLTILKLQKQLVAAQKEVSSTRYSDVGAALGARTSEAVSLRQELSRLEIITDTNATISARLDVTQAALDGAAESSKAFLDTLIASRTAATGPKIVHDAAEANLSGLIDTANTSFGGVYLFAGVNTDVQPVQPYFNTPTPANRQAVADAFQARFGFSQSDPAVASISPTDMSDFIDTTFSALFEEPAWSANWSNAADQNIRSRISVFEVIDTSTNANEDAFRKLAKVYTMMSDLGVENLNSETFEAVVDKAMVVAGQATQDLATLRANLGTAEGRIALADTKMDTLSNIITNRINGLEAVDPFDAAVRVTTLMTQIETAYALTARVQRLTLLNYL